MTEPFRISVTRLLLWIALAVACGLSAYEIPRRGIDPDEFEHLHAAFLVHRGDIPYRDFFEHHGPLLYYALAPLFRLFGAELAVLWWGRVVMALCSLGTLALTAQMARRLGGPSAGLIAATLLAWTSIFHAKGIELRPDVPATLLITGCVALALESPACSKRWILIGALAGLATMFTQKSIVVVAGLTLAAVYRELSIGTAKFALRIPVAVAIGGAAVWGAAFFAFSAAGAAGDFFHGTVVQLLTWPVRSRRWDQLRPTLAADLTVWMAGCAGIVAAFRNRGNREPRDHARVLLGITATFAVVSLAWVKATYFQYYLLWIPLLTVLAADRLLAWSAARMRSWAMRAACVFGVLLVAFEVALWWRAIELNQNGPLPHLTLALGRDATGTFIPVSLIFLAGLGGAGLLIARRTWSTLIAALAALGMFQALLRNSDFALWPNGPQIAAIAAVHRAVGPEEAVLDGFSGYGALRPHAYYYWWINEYSLALMTADEREGKLLARLEESPPRAVIFDRHLQQLPTSVTDWIRRHYQPMDDIEWLWLPRDRDQSP